MCSIDRKPQLTLMQQALLQDVLLFYLSFSLTLHLREVNEMKPSLGQKAAHKIYSMNNLQLR